MILCFFHAGVEGVLPFKGFFFLFLTLVLSLSGQAELTFSLSPTLTKNIFNAWALLNGGKGVLAHSH